MYDFFLLYNTKEYILKNLSVVINSFFFVHMMKNNLFI